MDCVLQLVNNPIEVFEETSRLLLKIADNVLSSPSNPKVRMLQKTNETIKKKILNVNGGIACLKAMGFQENDQNFNLPTTDSLKSLKQIRQEINKLKNGENSIVPEQTKNIPSTVSLENNAKPKGKTVDNEKNCTKVEENGIVPETFKRITLPPYTSLFSNPFLKEIELIYNRVLYYENSYLQERALSVIPLRQLEENAQINLRSLQERIKREKLKDPEVNLQDFLILELLAWFKNDFFEWVDNPPCVSCKGKTKFSHGATDKELLIYTDRVEMHKCEKCDTLTPFPRYNDVNILLETRKGRCGEWANVFTLMCCAMGWDARFVMDQTDHVWSEVYSFSQRRWLHCDPCENVCDNPLMYEAGWKKQVSYVIAFSAEEVQDVTWRYSSCHKAVLKRRKKCTEEELVSAMAILRDVRQKKLSQSRQEYLNKRFLSEVIELMVEKQPSDSAQQGRTSGSLDWRLTRGETQAANASKFIWEFSATDVAKDFVTIQYSTALDQYQKIVSGGSTTNTVVVSQNWLENVYETEGVFRKVESDWKQAYLCRTESSPTGHITWKFKVNEKNYVFDQVSYNIARTTFENGTVTAKICNANQCVLLTSDQGKTSDFSGSNEITITTQFLGGKGNNAWQHAQICREDLNSEEFSFKITFTFKRV